MIMRKLCALIVLVCLLSSAGCSGRAVVKEATAPERLAAHRPAVTGTHGLVTSGHSLASMAGIRTLIRGGNAADAAVSVLATLNLVEPLMSGAAGNGFMTIYDKATDRV